MLNSLRGLPKFGTVRPHYIGTPYPSLVFEISHTNESRPQMVTNARTKAFARTTSIQVYVGLKVYSKHMRAMWGRRTDIGRGMRMERLTHKFPIAQQTGLSFRIPTQLIFWGCSVIPPHMLQHCVIPLEAFRQALHQMLR
jgi:hypothetical protein